jgi:O-antigen/teichoic acid export membrane protein
MKTKLVQNLSVNAFQLIVNQVFGLGVFYVLSTGLDKNNFGQINLALALLLAVFNILSCGIDQLVVKKIAGGADTPRILSLYIFHVVVTGLAFYLLLFLFSLFFSQSANLYSLVLLLGIGKLMSFFATPFKQAANGLEKFKLLAWMSVISNFVRCCGLTALAFLHHLTMQNIVIVFIAGDVLEMFISIILFNRATKTPLNFSWDKTGYFSLLREALPQTGVVLITSALARFDWLFIGFMVSAVKLAEYSFAYKVFELSTLPLLAIAPLLVPRFTKMIKFNFIPVTDLKLLVRAEMIIAVFVGLLLNSCWAPLIDYITHGKYGAINVTTVFILSLCMPLLYLNNFLWTIYFAQGRLKMILTSFIITFSVNVIGDVVLIPFYKNEGAAFAFLLACLVQCVFYIKKNTISGLTNLWQPMAMCLICAFSSGFSAQFFFSNKWLTPFVAALLYFFLLFISRQIKANDAGKIKRLFYS